MSKDIVCYLYVFDKITQYIELIHLRVGASVVSVNGILTDTFCITADFPALTLTVSLTLVHTAI